jgi:hypothetical protein
VTTTDQLAEIEARIRDCRSYKFGMRNADKLAHEDAPALLAVVREQRAVIERVADRAEIHEESAYTGPKGSISDWERGFNDGKAAVAEAIRAAITATEGS